MSTLVQQIGQKLSSLYFLNSQEISDLLKQLGNLPEEALGEILEIIKASTEKQNEYISKVGKEDPQFAEKLKIFLQSNVKTLIAAAKFEKL